MFRWLRHLRSMPLALLLALQAIQISPAFAGLNLCIGADGHFEIESQSGECCPSRMGEAPESTLDREEGACDSCIDVSLGENEIRTLASAKTPTFQEILPAPHPSEKLPSFRPARTAFLSRGFPTEPSLTAIRSVVLRV